MQQENLAKVNIIQFPSARATLEEVRLSGLVPELHRELKRITKEKGRVGEAAKAVGKILHLHFVKEEEYAMPPLGLLTILAEGKVSVRMKEALVMTDRLKGELDTMLKEHKEIVAALKKLIVAAKKENKLEYVSFADKLIMHAQTEEHVYYPASLLIGRYLKLKLKKRSTAAA